MAYLRRPVSLSLVVLAGVTIAASCGTATHHAGQKTQALPPLPRRSGRHRIVFVNAVEGAFGAIYTIRVDGHGLRRLAKDAYEPAASPSRKRLAYTEGNESRLVAGIAVMRANGTRKVRITAESERVDDQPAWSPDGRSIIFVSTSTPGASGGLFEVQLVRVRSNGSGLRLLKEAPAEVDSPGPSWIDNQHILVTSGLGELAVLSSQTGRVERRVVLPRSGTQPAPEAAALSPSHKEIAYTECVNDDCSSTALNLITLRGRLLRRIPGGRSAAWSPRGDLLYSCCEEPSNLGNSSRIFFVEAGGDTARPITPSSIQADSPVWLG